MSSPSEGLEVLASGSSGDLKQDAQSWRESVSSLGAGLKVTQSVALLNWSRTRGHPDQGTCSPKANLMLHWRGAPGHPWHDWSSYREGHQVTGSEASCTGSGAQNNREGGPVFALVRASVCLECGTSSHRMEHQVTEARLEVTTAGADLKATLTTVYT